MDQGFARGPICESALGQSDQVVSFTHVLDRDCDDRERDAPRDQAAEDLGHAEADDHAENRAPGDQLGCIRAGERFRIEVRADMAVELVDAIADAVAGAYDRPLDRLLLIGLGHYLLLIRVKSALIASMSVRMCSIASFGTKFTPSSFFFPIVASTA